MPLVDMFHPWPRLPTELKLEVLQYTLAQPDLITHSRHLDNLRVCSLSPFISSRNKELAQLAIDACKSKDQDYHIAETKRLLDYKSNTFLIAPHVLRTTFGPRFRLLRPKPQHAQRIQ